MDRGDDYSSSRRVVLLFDLDCFYAQCERLRLGFDCDVSLALLQWDSVLAVTYPARKFGIKRGDSWDAVAKKSNKNCWAIHLEVLPRPSTTETKSDEFFSEEGSSTDDEALAHTEKTSVEEAYSRTYCLSKDEQRSRRTIENGRRRYHFEGKACLERYRIASMHIFSTVLKIMTNITGGKKTFTLERASIDEFYLDITEWCFRGTNISSSDQNDGISIESTVEMMNHQVRETDKELLLALRLGCTVSALVRREVKNRLGFTISAGVSTNKMMSKLAASYGKPNGQAMMHPSFFIYILQKTRIRDVRNFGGKLGRQIALILSKESSPSNFHARNPTMGDLQGIPLPVLQQHFTEDVACFVFKACRGFDAEEVKETKGALVKSISVFKSFPATSRAEDVESWIALMAKEVASRVAADSARNRRYPRNCSLSYSYYATMDDTRPKERKSSSRISRSVQLGYPPDTQSKKGQYLTQLALERLLPVLRDRRITGVGLSAKNFAYMDNSNTAKNGIARFFSSKEAQQSPRQIANDCALSDENNIQNKRKRPPIPRFFGKSKPQEPKGASSTQSRAHKMMSCTNDDSSGSPSQVLDSRVLGEANNLDSKTEESRSLSESLSEPNCECDVSLAKKMQAVYDREHYVLSTSERFVPIKHKKLKSRKTIESFFGKG